MSEFVTLNPGDKIADHLSTAIPWSKLQAAGYKAEAVYLKALTPSYIAQAALDRRPLVIIFEQSATAGTLGAAAGQNDGIHARAQARSLGIPDDVEIICASFDYDVGAANIAQSMAYAQAFITMAAPAGRYGDRDLIDATMYLGGTNWQMSAGWFSRVLGNVVVHPAAHVKQSTSLPFFNSRIDPNVVLRPMNVWVPSPVAPPPPPAPPIVYDPAHGKWGLFPFNTNLRTLTIGVHDPAVVFLKDVIRYKAGGDIGTGDLYDAHTAARVRQLQRVFKILEDGICGWDRPAPTAKPGPNATWPAVLYLAGH